MPAMSPTMVEGSIVNWSVRPGESFHANDVLLDIETDKAQISIEAQDDGVLAKALVDAGARGVKVGQPIAILAEPEEEISSIDYDSLLASHEQPSLDKSEEKRAKEDNLQALDPKKTVAFSDSVTKRSDVVLMPSVLRLLHTHNKSPKDAAAIKGTGPGGRILKGDVLAFLGDITGEVPSAEAERIEKLGHLDLSYQKREMKTPSEAAVSEKPLETSAKPALLKVTVISDDVKIHPSVPNINAESVKLLVARANRKALRECLEAVKPKPSALRNLTLDFLCQPSQKIPFKHDAQINIKRGKPHSVIIKLVVPKDKRSEKMAEVYRNAILVSLNDISDVSN